MYKHFYGGQKQPLLAPPAESKRLLLIGLKNLDLALGGIFLSRLIIYWAWPILKV